jgi:hypothetical protein
VSNNKGKDSGQQGLIVIELIHTREELIDFIFVIIIFICLVGFNVALDGVLTERMSLVVEDCFAVEDFVLDTGIFMACSSSRSSSSSFSSLGSWSSGWFSMLPEVYPS